MNVDAHRLAACLDACQGIPLEVLQANASGGLTWSVADQIEQRVKASKLLAALIEHVNAHAVPLNAGKERAAYERARAAIAYAAGGTA